MPKLNKRAVEPAVSRIKTGDVVTVGDKSRPHRVVRVAGGSAWLTVGTHGVTCAYPLTDLFLYHGVQAPAFEE